MAKPIFEPSKVLSNQVESLKEDRGEARSERLVRVRIEVLQWHRWSQELRKAALNERAVN